MRHRESTAPVTFLALVLPYGISGGFISVTLPFILVREGYSVAAAGAIAALGVSANLWRFSGDRWQIFPCPRGVSTTSGSAAQRPRC